MGASRTLVDGLDHPEGVAWDASRRAVWTGGEDGQLYRVDPESGAVEEVARATGLVLGVAVDGRGRIVLCCAEDRSIQVWDGSSLRRVHSDGLSFPNSPAFAPDGTLFVSDSGRWRANDGTILRIDADGTVELFSDAAPHFTNGCAVSTEGAFLWTVESYVPTVSRFDLASGAHEVVTRIEGTVLDGIAFTADGGVLLACYRPDRIYHLAASGSLEIVAEDPQGTRLAAPTNVCFVGERLDRVVAANFNRRHLSLLDLGLVGVPLHAPERWAADAL